MSTPPKSGVREVLEALGKTPIALIEPTGTVDTPSTGIPTPPPVFMPEPPPMETVSTKPPETPPITPTPTPTPTTTGPQITPPVEPVKPRRKAHVGKFDRPPSQQLAEFTKEVKPLDWSEKDTRMNTKALHSSLVDTHKALLDDVPYAPPTDLIFGIGDPLTIGTRYAPSMMSEKDRKTYNPFTVAELNDTGIKAKIEGLTAVEQGLSELMGLTKPSVDPITQAPVKPLPAKDFWETAEELWFSELPESDKPRGHPAFSLSFAARNPRSGDFEKAFKEQKIAPTKLTLGIDPGFEKRIAETQSTLGTTPVAVCLGDKDRTILFNEANFMDDKGAPDYDKADAVLIHESHHAMSKGFVNAEIFGEELHDTNWGFDEIVTEHYAKKMWDKKYPGREDEYFKYTSYFKGGTQSPDGTGWIGHAAQSLFSACGGEKVVAKAYFAGHPESWGLVLAAKSRLVPLIDSAR